LRARAIGNSFRVMTFSFVPPKSIIAINQSFFSGCWFNVFSSFK